MPGSEPAVNRLAELVRAIVSDPGYANGVRSSDHALTESDALTVLAECSTPVTRRPMSASRPSRRSSAGPSRASWAARRAAPSLVLVSTVEARMIARELARPERAETRAGFLARAPAWIGRGGGDERPSGRCQPGAKYQQVHASAETARARAGDVPAQHRRRV